MDFVTSKLQLGLAPVHWHTQWRYPFDFQIFRGISL